jgi:histidine triad (HIT) family protein
MASIFSRIIHREIPGYFIAEDNRFVAILDAFPLTIGHTLVIPKIEIDYLFDLQDETLSEMNIFAKKVAIAMKKAIQCKKIGVAVIGLEVPHAHIHLIPIVNVSDLNFANPKLSLSPEQLAQTRDLIKAFL